MYRANHYGDEARSVSPADQQTDDVREDLDRYRTRASDKAYRAADQAGQKYDDAKQQGRETYDEAKQKGRGIWGSVKDFFGEPRLPGHDTMTSCVLAMAMMSYTWDMLPTLYPPFLDINCTCTHIYSSKWLDEHCCPLIALLFLRSTCSGLFSRFCEQAGVTIWLKIAILKYYFFLSNNQALEQLVLRQMVKLACSFAQTTHIYNCL